jgi:predicted nucleic acid-binding protein
MSIYADTNFFSFLYLRDPATSEALALLRSHRYPVLPITWLLRIEIVNALQQAVFSGFGEDQTRITPELAGACQQAFREDLRDEIAVCAVQMPLSEAIHLFEEISLRHTAKHGFRTYDILHVASALVLKCRTFWSFDKRASKLAKLEGLKTI